MKISKMMRKSLVLGITLLAFSMVVPVSGGMPKKLQAVQGERRVDLWGGFDYYDDGIGALVWEVFADEIFFINHGWFNNDTKVSIQGYPSRGWLDGHPLTCDFYIDGEKILTTEITINPIILSTE